MIIENLPFYPNTPDDTHCFQAALRAVLKFFIPGREFSFEELDEISRKKEGKWTWPMAALVWMRENGFDVKVIEPFNYEKFIEGGDAYLVDEFGKEVAKAQIENSDIVQEREVAKAFLQKIDVVKSAPGKEKIFDLMKQGYLVMVNVNSKALNDSEGYAGHFVVIKGYNDSGFILNDPGLPPAENKNAPFDTFEKAWAYPNEKAKNIMAFKLI